MQWDMAPERRAAALTSLLALAGAASGCIPEQASLAPPDAAADTEIDTSQPDAPQDSAEAEAAPTCPGPCPTVIAEGLSQPWGIAVDNANVYWTDHTKSKVYSCPRTGCVGEPTAIASNEAGASGLDQRGGLLAWTNAHAGLIRTCDPIACNAQTLAEGQSEPDQVTLTKDFTLWSNLGTGQIMALFSALPSGPMEIAKGESRPGIIASSNNEVYWVAQGSTPLVSDGAIRVSVWTGEGFTPPGSIADSLPGASGLALSATHVFWTALGAEKVSGRIYSFARDYSGAATVVAANQDEPSAIAFQDSTLYWLNRGNGTVMRCEAAACASPQAIAINQTQPWSLAVDANGIFWTDRGSGKVLMLPRQ